MNYGNVTTITASNQSKEKIIKISLETGKKMYKVIDEIVMAYPDYLFQKCETCKSFDNNKCLFLERVITSDFCCKNYLKKE